MDQVADWQQQCATLDADRAPHAERGTDPADPAVQALARRFADLMIQVGGGDPATVSAIYARIDGERRRGGDPWRAEQRLVDLPQASVRGRFHRAARPTVSYSQPKVRVGA